MIRLERHGHVRVLHMDDGENRFNARSVTELHHALDEVEAVEGSCALVTTGAGKFYSNGLDLEWLGSGQATPAFLPSVHALLDRLMRIDVYTVAAVNGHAFAAGAMLAAAHDAVVMRTDRGYWCLPEIDLGLPLTPEMYAALAAKLPRATLADAALSGRRYTAAEALEAGIVTETAPDDQVLGRAVERAEAMAAKNRSVLATHKALLYGK
jgi:enoyl-CoA hydratase/carnithine racemase